MPRFRTTGSLLLASLLLAAAVSVCGCESYRIDPTGESLFIRDPAGVQPGSEGPASPMTGSVGASTPTTNLPGLAPTGDLRPSLPGVSGASIAPGSGPILLVSPQSTIAPVGSEVVMLASYLEDDGYLRTNEQIQWSLDGAGSIMTVAPGGWNDWVFMDYTCSRRLSEKSAVTTTTRRLWTVDRGTADPSDDVKVLRGQSWITLRSATSGVSHVTALAPSIENWERRSQTGTIYWVDAQWTLPSPGIAPVGRPQTLTTTLTRQTNQAPIEGWTVRYEITGGPAAGLAQSGAQIVEVPTNEQGQARVDLQQTSPTPGTNTIQIEIVRPSGVAGCDRALVVGTGSVTQTWTGGAGASSLSIQTTGPASATLGETALYRLLVENQSNVTVPEARVTLPIPSGMSFVSSNPTPTVQEETLEWTLASLPPGSQQSIDVNLRLESPGAMTVRAEVVPVTGGALPGNVAPPPSPPSTYQPSPLPTGEETTRPNIDLTLTGPGTAETGKMVEFLATITNLGSSPTGPLILRDRFDEGLSIPGIDSPNNALDRNLDSLAAGESIDIDIVMRVEQSGYFCNEVQILEPQDYELLATANKCLRASGSAAGETGAPEPPSTSDGSSATPGTTPGETAPDDLQLKIVGPESFEVGEPVTYIFRIENYSYQPQGPVDLRVHLPKPPFEALELIEGGRAQPADHAFVWSIQQIDARTRDDTYRMVFQAVEAISPALITAELWQGDRRLAEAEASVTITSGEGGAGGPGERPGIGDGSGFDSDTPSGSTEGTTDSESPVEMIISSAMQSATGEIAVEPGDQFTVLVSVAPRNQQGLTNLELRVALPQNMSLDRLRTTGPEPPSSYDSQRNEIVFQPVYRTQQGMSATYRLRLIAKGPGSGTFEATATSAEYPNGFRASVPITVAQ